MSSGYTLGPYWQDGRLAKPVFLAPALRTYLKNIKRLIVENQATAFAIVSESEALTLAPFNAESIHIGASTDVNSRAVYIVGKVRSSLVSSNRRRDEVEVRIIATTGPQATFDEAYQLATAYLAGVQMIFEAFDPRELVFGWLGSKVPGIVIGEQSANPMNPAAAPLSIQLGAVPELVFN